MVPARTRGKGGSQRDWPRRGIECLVERITGGGAVTEARIRYRRDRPAWPREKGTAATSSTSTESAGPTKASASKKAPDRPVHAGASSAHRGRDLVSCETDELVEIHAQGHPHVATVSRYGRRDVEHHPAR